MVETPWNREPSAAADTRYIFKYIFVQRTSGNYTKARKIELDELTVIYAEQEFVHEAAINPRSFSAPAIRERKKESKGILKRQSNPY